MKRHLLLGLFLCACGEGEISSGGAGEDFGREDPDLAGLDGIGGFGTQVMQYLALEGLLDGGVKFRPMTLPDVFIDHESPAKQYAEAGLDAPHIVATAMAAGMGLGSLANVIHPYPTLAEAIRQCGDDYNRTRLTASARTWIGHWLRWNRNR